MPASRGVITPRAGTAGRPAYRWAVALYDRAYCWLHRLDRPESEAGPALRVEIRRCHRARILPDGTRLHPGDRVAILHLDNARITALHLRGRSPLAVGLEFRRHLVASLRRLAALAADGQRLGEVRAFTATTIFHTGLARLGFSVEPRRPAWSRLVAAYQRALLASIHPAGGHRPGRITSHRARRLWLSRQALLARYLQRPGVTPSVAEA